MNKYLVIVVGTEAVGTTETRKSFASFYSKEFIETTDLKGYIPSRVGQCKYRTNYDNSMDIVIKVF